MRLVDASFSTSPAEVPLLLPSDFLPELSGPPASADFSYCAKVTCHSPGGMAFLRICAEWRNRTRTRPSLLLPLLPLLLHLLCFVTPGTVSEPRYHLTKLTKLSTPHMSLFFSSPISTFLPRRARSGATQRNLARTHQPCSDLSIYLHTQVGSLF